MSKERKHNPNGARRVTVAECLQRHEKIDLALWGSDGRGGIVKDISDIKSKLTDLLERQDETKTKSRDWRLLGFAILGSTITGLIIVAANYVLTHIA